MYEAMHIFNEDFELQNKKDFKIKSIDFWNVL